MNNPFLDANIADIYARHAPLFHNYQVGIDNFQALVPKEATILEVGVGTGEFTKRLLERGYAPRGIDASQEMVQRAPEQVQDITTISSLEAYQTQERYDVIVSHSGGFTYKEDGLETYINDEDELIRALEKMLSLLAPNGRVLISKTKGAAFQRKHVALKTTKTKRGKIRVYEHAFKEGAEKTKVTQERLFLTREELEDLGVAKWDFSAQGYIIASPR